MSNFKNVATPKNSYSDGNFSQALEALRRYHSDTHAAGERLHAQWSSPVGNVPREFVRLGVGAPWIWSDRMAEFYRETDGFIYELVTWHHRPDRIAWRQLLAKQFSPGMTVLCLGDGIGYDACEIGKMQPGVRVTSFEFPGHSSAFAQRMIEDLRLTNVEQTTELPSHGFDAVVCLDVFEHVPDPLNFVDIIASHVATGGRAYVSESCGLVKPTHPTHLQSNLQYAGRILPLFERHSLAFRGLLTTSYSGIRIFEKDGERWPLRAARLRHFVGGHKARYLFRRRYPQGTTDMATFVASARAS